jgi:hypothetical protein
MSLIHFLGSKKELDKSCMPPAYAVQCIYLDSIVLQGSPAIACVGHSACTRRRLPRDARCRHSSEHQSKESSLMSVPPSEHLNNRRAAFLLIKGRHLGRRLSFLTTTRHTVLGAASGDLFPTKDARGLSLGVARQPKAKPRSNPRFSE